MAETVIQIENLKKQYRLGTIGGGTLSHDIQSWWARKRGKEDPNVVIGKENLGKDGRDTFWALNGINLEVKKGEAVGIIGANGAGKSTMLKILSRVTAPTEGEIRIKGRIASMLEVGTGFHGELTGRENIYMNGAILGMSKNEVDSKIEQIIDFSECRQFIDTPVKRYSSGMYVKLAFSVAAHLDAEILVMDEVLAVGDMKFQQKCLGKMGDVAENEGRTVLYVSHNMGTIRQLCTRCIVLKDGRVIFDGDVEEAIQVYMDANSSDFSPNYNLAESSRPNILQGKKVFLENLQFGNKDKAVFYRDEPVQFSVTFTAKEDVEDLHLQSVIRFADSTIVGMSLSDQAMQVKKGETYTVQYSFDASNLAAGMYYFTPVLCAFNEFGSREVYDVVTQKVFFTIEESKKDDRLQWHRQFWGSVQLNPLSQIQMTCIEEKNYE